MNLQSIFDWLLTLPPSTLLPVMGLLAAAENVFPPIPADALIALGVSPGSIVIACSGKLSLNSRSTGGMMC